MDGSAEAPPLPAGEGGSYDEFDMWADPPNNGTPAIRGMSQAGQTEWRLYVYDRDDGRTCVHFAARSPAHGVASGNCKFSAFEPTLSTSDVGRFGFGIAPADAVAIRFEHVDAMSETLEAVQKEGRADRFFAGDIAATPLRRIVALDSSGRIIAERTDVGTTG